MVDRSIKKPIRIFYDFFVRVDRLIFIADLIVFDNGMDVQVHIILSRPFLATDRTLVDVERGNLMFWVNDEEVSFKIYEMMKRHGDFKVNVIIDVVDEVLESIGELAYSKVESLAEILLNYDKVDVDNCEGVVVALIGVGSHSRVPTKLDIDLKDRETQPAKPSIEAPPDLQLKELLSHLKFTILGMINTLPVIVATKL